MKGEGGHPFSNTNKSVLSTSLQIPDQFNLDLEISSIDSPRFLFTIGFSKQSADSDSALKLETWDDEIVLVQGQIFEPVTTIKDAQKVVRISPDLWYLLAIPIPSSKYLINLLELNSIDLRQ